MMTENIQKNLVAECREASKQPAIADDKKHPQNQATETVNDLLAPPLFLTELVSPEWKSNLCKEK